MKIAFFEISDKEKEVFLPVSNVAETVFFGEKLSESNAILAKDVDAICVFVGCTINKAVIDALPSLKFIATRSTGFDHIDHDYAKSKGIVVANVPGYGSRTVAEFAFGLISQLARNIIVANNQIRNTRDFNYKPEMEGFELAGKTLGVIGTGKIGKNAIRIAKGFGMKVLAYDLYPDELFSKEQNFTYVSFEEVLSSADIITLHAPYTKENHHLINKENIYKIKKGAYIINTARGELVETEALLMGLRNGIIQGAGLDVLENERPLKEGTNEKEEITKMNFELMNMPNVVITPHIAFFTKEAVAEIQKITLDNVNGFLKGSPQNAVN